MLDKKEESKEALTADAKSPLISYYANQASQCPVCKTEFHRELLHSGRGRLISEHISPELRRLYKPNDKYGNIYPQAYSILTCPQCLYSAFPNDFVTLEDKEVEALYRLSDDRRQKTAKILGQLSFREKRNLVLGAASYLLAVECYQKRSLRVAPTPKKAVCSLRAAWLFFDLGEELPHKDFDKLSKFLYLKAAAYYIRTLTLMGGGAEPQSQFLYLLGPDVDKNWHFEGVIYISSYLIHEYIEELSGNNQDQKIKLLREAQRNVSRLYGHGKASIAKPSLIVGYARELYETVSDELETLLHN